MNELKQKSEDKIEIVKQQQKKHTLILQKKIFPKKNHLLFKYNYIKDEFSEPKYEPIRKEIHWHEAKSNYLNRVQKKIDLSNPDSITKSQVIIEKDCIYISAMNIENAIKILKREYNISYEQN